MRIDQAVNIEDLHRMAKRRLPKIAFDYIEGGIEGGRDLDAITAFQFVNQQGAAIGSPCIPAANNPLQTCVKNNSAIDTNSRVDVLRASRLRTGIFWHGLVDVPIDLLPSNRREVYMILRNEEECHVEG